MLEKLLKDMNDYISNEIFDASQRPAKIVLKNTKKGMANISLSGDPVAILVLLAGSTKQILKDLNTSDETFEKIKSRIGTEEGKNE